MQFRLSAAAGSNGELMAVFLTLKYFLPHLGGQHMLVKSDNSTVVAYVNHQGGTCSPRLHKLVRKIILWSVSRLGSLRATHVAGVLNRGADFMSRGKPSIQGMETPSPGGEPAVAEIRAGLS